MTRFIFFIFALQTICFVSFPRVFGEESDEVEESTAPPPTPEPGALPAVFCGFAGAQYNVTYQFKAADLPARCDAVVYGYYYVDMEFDAADLEAIKCLVEQGGTTVFTFVTFGQVAQWEKFLDPNDKTSFTEYIEPLETFIKDNAINGIILDALGLFNNETQEYGTKLNDFINKIKEDVPDLQIGIMVPGDRYLDFGNVELFDFTQTNEAVNMYIIDTTLAQNGCYENTTEIGGRLPITTTAEGSASLEAITQAIKDTSGMDLSKVVVNFFIQATMYDPASQIPTGLTYTDYCSEKSSSADPSIVWCVDSSQMFHDQAQFLINSTAAVGIMLTYLDYDDPDGTCECGAEKLFPVTNTYIDGWYNCPIQTCEKLA